MQVEAFATADHSSKGVLPSVLIRLQNLRCEAARGPYNARTSQEKLKQVTQTREKPKCFVKN
jgi:hypothetical protein